MEKLIERARKYGYVIISAAQTDEKIDGMQPFSAEILGEVNFFNYGDTAKDALSKILKKADQFNKQMT